MQDRKEIEHPIDIHLCWDCSKASVQGQCQVYESITNLIEDNFDKIKILFSVPECEFFKPENR